MKFFNFIGGFFEVNTNQSMTRLSMFLTLIFVFAILGVQLYKGDSLDWQWGLTWIAAIFGLKLVQNGQEAK